MRFAVTCGVLAVIAALSGVPPAPAYAAATPMDWSSVIKQRCRRLLTYPSRPSPRGMACSSGGTLSGPGFFFAMTDPIAERGRKIGGTTLRSIGHIARLQRLADNDAEYVEPQDMLAELKDDNIRLTSAMREVHNTCDEYGDVATASLLEVWIDETERRSWFLHEATHRQPGSNG